MLMQATQKKLYQLRGQLQALSVSDAHVRLAGQLIGEAIFTLQAEKQLEVSIKEKLTQELQYEITYYLRASYATSATQAAKRAAFQRAKENAIRWITRALSQLDPP
jgi:hypothetical protein